MPSKILAVLYYLAAISQPQPRSTLATLLWGDLIETAARANLRKALLRLSQSLGNYLKIDRQTVALNSNANTWIDVVEFEAHQHEADFVPDIASLQAAVKLYRGDFLQGFYVLRAPDFEAWLRDEFPQAIGYTRYLLALEP